MYSLFYVRDMSEKKKKSRELWYQTLKLFQNNRVFFVLTFLSVQFKYNVVSKYQ